MHMEVTRKIKLIKPYLVEFEEDSTIKSKIYLYNFAIRGLNWWQIIFITNNKSIYIKSKKYNIKYEKSYIYDKYV